MKRFAAILFVAVLMPLSGSALASTLDWLSFSYGSYFAGTWDYSVYEYNDEYYLDAQGLNGVDLNVTEKKLETSQVDGLMEIIDDCEINSWDGFDQRDDNKRDGDSFEIDIAYLNGTKISASGYEKYPDGYWDAWSKLTDYFEELTA